MPRIERHVPYPNPGAACLVLKLSAPANRVRVRVYSTAMNVVGQSDSGPYRRGWNRVPLPNAVVQAPHGVYFYVAEACGAEGCGPTAGPGKMFIGR